MGSRDCSGTFVSHNGSVYFCCASLKQGEQNISLVTRFTFDKEKGIFARDTSIDSRNIAQHDVCYSLKGCIDFLSESERLTVLLGKQNNREYNLFHMKNDQLHHLCVFTIDDVTSAVPTLYDDCRADSEMCTQTMVQLQVNTPDLNTQCRPNINPNTVIILDGPTVVLFVNDKIYFSDLSRSNSTGHKNAAKFTKATFNVREYSLLWIGVIDNHIIMLGTECDTGGDKMAFYRNEQSLHNMRSKVPAKMKKFTAARIEQTSCDKSKCRGQVETTVKYIQSKEFIPDIYSNIFTCISVNNCCAVNSSSKDADVVDQCLTSSMYHNEIFMCTTHKQLLHLKNGGVIDCVAVSTDCAVHIRCFETLSGETYIVILSADKQMTLVKQLSFQVVQIISDVNSFLLDDFITNGAEQLLVLLNSSQDQIVTTEESSYLRNYILTDCEGVYIESGLKNSSHKHNEDRCSESVYSAVQALKMRQQVTIQALFEAQQLSDAKFDVIFQTCDTLKKFSLQSESGCVSKMRNSVVQFLGSDETDMERIGDFLQNCSRKDTTIQCMSTTRRAHTDSCSSLTTASNSQPNIPRVKVLDIWYRVVAPDCLVVGTKIHNTTDCQIGNISIHLISMQKAYACERETVYKSQTVNVTEKIETSILTVTEPPCKKSRKRPLLDIQEVIFLPKDCTCYVLATTPFPMFSCCTTKSFALFLVWNGPYEATGDRSSTLQYQNCGKICISVDEMCSGLHLLNLKDLILCDSINLEAALCLEVLQKAKTLRLSWHFNGLIINLNRTLDLLGFKYSSYLDCYICDFEGYLQWVKVKILQSEKLAIDMDVSVRNDKQLVFFIHALYSKLPKGVIIEMLSDEALSNAITGSIHDLYSELTLTESCLSELLRKASGRDKHLNPVSQDVTHIRASFEELRARTIKRDYCLLEKTILDGSLLRWKEASQLTDLSVHRLVNIIKL